MNIPEVKIKEVKPIWVAWTNTDRTEGRGWQIPFCVAETYETAVRMGKKGGVMGSPCDVTEGVAVKINNQWLVPGRIFPESKEDTVLREQREAKEAAIAKAKAAGLTDDDLEALK